MMGRKKEGRRLADPVSNMADRLMADFNQNVRCQVMFGSSWFTFVTSLTKLASQFSFALTGVLVRVGLTKLTDSSSSTCEMTSCNYYYFRLRYTRILYRNRAKNLHVKEGEH